MLFGRVRGTALSTLKYQGLEGVKLLIIQPLDSHLHPVGGLVVAADTVMAGASDLCVMARAREASLALPNIKFVPVDLAITGIVDELTVRPDGEQDFTLKHGQNRFT
jgi:ethanolamine utilization protein EutN